MASPKTFAARLRLWRKGRKLVQKEAAQLLGVELDCYRSWESGRTAPHETPSMREVEQKMFLTTG